METDTQNAQPPRKQSGGQPGPHSKPDQEEFRRRIDFCVRLIAGGFKKGQIKRACLAQFNAKPRTVERYLARAREVLREETGKSKQDLRGEAYAFYASVLADTKATVRDKILARKRIDELLGLDEPKLVHQDVTQTGSLHVKYEEMTPGEIEEQARKNFERLNRLSFFQRGGAA